MRNNFPINYYIIINIHQVNIYLYLNVIIRLLKKDN